MNYFNKNNKFLHGVMFHHFHDKKKHIKSQGSIDAKDLTKIIKFIGRKNILNADEFLNKKNSKFLSNKVCLTFDDGLKSQYDIAIPVLKKFGIKAFFFIYTSIFSNKPELLEVYRYFRSKYFSDINFFYKSFFLSIKKKGLNLFLKKQKKEIKNKKKLFPFYSINDIKFRLIRDKFLKSHEYKETYDTMFKAFNFRPNKIYKKVFLSKKNLKKISSNGHMIGLHSHSHPTQFSNLSLTNQKKELILNNKILKKIINKKIKSISYPCGNYNNQTLKILKNMNINFGFKQILNKKSKFIKSNLEIPREDHSNIMKRIR